MTDFEGIPVFTRGQVLGDAIHIDGVTSINWPPEVRDEIEALIQMSLLLGFRVEPVFLPSDPKGS